MTLWRRLAEQARGQRQPPHQFAVFKCQHGRESASPRKTVHDDAVTIDVVRFEEMLQNLSSCHQVVRIETGRFRRKRCHHEQPPFLAERLPASQDRRFHGIACRRNPDDEIPRILIGIGLRNKGPILGRSRLPRERVMKETRLRLFFLPPLGVSLFPADFVTTRNAGKSAGIVSVSAATFMSIVRRSLPRTIKAEAVVPGRRRRTADDNCLSAGHLLAVPFFNAIAGDNSSLGGRGLRKDEPHNDAWRHPTRPRVPAEFPGTPARKDEARPST